MQREYTCRYAKHSEEQLFWSSFSVYSGSVSGNLQQRNKASDEMASGLCQRVSFLEALKGQPCPMAKDLASTTQLYY